MTQPDTRSVHAGQDDLRALGGPRPAGRPHVVAVRPLYGGSDHLLSTALLGTAVTWTGAADVAGAVRPGTGLIVVETPANPTVELMDVAAVVRQAGGVPVLVDNTFATPVLQQPARHGATIVLHSATKDLGGHGDVMGGLVAATTEWTTRLRQVRAVIGGLLHPLAAYELHRGSQTMPVRVRAQQAGADKLTRWLTTHPAVDQVFYPGLQECDPLGLVGRQQSGPGAVLAFTTAGGYETAARVATFRGLSQAAGPGC